MEQKKLILSWEDMLILTDNMAFFLSDKNITDIVTLARGGYIVSRIIAQKINIRRIYSIGIEFYNNENSANIPQIYQTLTQKFNDNRHIAIIDDIIDSGKSIEIAEREVANNGGKRIITCAMHYKPHSKYKPNYYAQKVDNDVWVDYCWE